MASLYLNSIIVITVVSISFFQKKKKKQSKGVTESINLLYQNDENYPKFL